MVHCICQSVAVQTRRHTFRKWKRRKETRQPDRHKTTDHSWQNMWELFSTLHNYVQNFNIVVLKFKLILYTGFILFFQQQFFQNFPRTPVDFPDSKGIRLINYCSSTQSFLQFARIPPPEIVYFLSILFSHHLIFVYYYYNKFKYRFLDRTF